MLAYSPAGRLLWQRMIEPTEPALLVGLSLQLDPDRRSVYVLSRGVPPAPASWYGATVSLDAGTGRQRWAADYVDRPGRDYVAEELALDPTSGRVFITGSYGEATLTAVAYDPTGDQLWAARDGGGLGGEVNDVEADPLTGNVFITGSTFTFDPFLVESLRTIAYSGSGARLWERREPVSGDLGDSALAVDPVTGAVVLASTPTSIGGQIVDLLTTAYAPSGAQLWRTVVPGINFLPGLPVDLEIDLRDRTVHVGHTYARTFPYTGFAPDTFDRNGGLVRQARYAVPRTGLDFADLAATPDGVYLTGTIDDESDFFLTDWLTLAYPPS